MGSRESCVYRGSRRKRRAERLEENHTVKSREPRENQGKE